MTKREIVRDDRVREIIHAEPNNEHQKRIIEANHRVMFSFRRYFMSGRNPGGFVTCCLRDSLTQAHGHADEHMQAVMGAVCLYLHNDMHARAWGDDGKVQTWKKENGLVGQSSSIEDAVSFAEGRI